MASIAREKNGTRRILFVAPDGKRKTIRLGKVPQRTAEAVKLRVEHLLAAKMSQDAVQSDTARWVAELEPRLAMKLAAVGLIAPRRPKATATLAAFLDDYIASRVDVKASTTRHLQDARKNLVAFFGSDKPLADISPGDADDFRRNLLTELGENTVRRRCGRAKQFFRAALRKRLIRENPFADMKGCSVQANRARDYFVTRDEAARVMEACPDAEWQLIFALSRFGGLRCPSEHLALRWGDVDWERNRIRIRSPKTEHIEGRDSRLIPIFPELRPYIERVWDEAGEGAEYLITRYRSATANLRTQLQRIIERAGLTPWPKLFQNLRASRATELAAEHPAHVAAAWLGHTTLVAQKHYWQVTEADYDRAALGGDKANSEAAQNPAQQAHATDSSGSKPPPASHEKTPELPGNASDCDVVQICSVTPTGLEPVLPA